MYLQNLNLGSSNTSNHLPKSYVDIDDPYTILTNPTDKKRYVTIFKKGDHFSKMNLMVEYNNLENVYEFIFKNNVIICDNYPFAIISNYMIDIFSNLGYESILEYLYYGNVNGYWIGHITI